MKNDDDMLIDLIQSLQNYVENTWIALDCRAVPKAVAGECIYFEILHIFKVARLTNMTKLSFS